MTTQTTVSRPAPFVEQLGQNLAENVLAQQQVPVIAPGQGGLSQLTGESAEDFAKRQAAGQRFDIRKQSIACLLYTSPSPRDGLLSRMPSSA